MVEFPAKHSRLGLAVGAHERLNLRIARRQADDCHRWVQVRLYGWIEIVILRVDRVEATLAFGEEGERRGGSTGSWDNKGCLVGMA